ncbi:DMSO/selenate family reductase complex A subunit [Nissabacter sp. SGAir0207]|uniref:DMSO/selenate family reductase complex A subunit n=1 Tax=Nissabacter sp. SGAir0207 TaxID=2126321 RepID=UPI0010CCB2F6|nr:DMSO/selenate family reductase complex A subunit [Nissabacter sp. SGAir0207]QCR36567.1 dimethyl sulfoxide reductase subunit A [Nissabacter sp. SGAir0207]
MSAAKVPLLAISRRTLLKGSLATSALAIAAEGIALPFQQSEKTLAGAGEPQSERVVWSACTVNCGSRCPLRMHVTADEIRYVESDNGRDDSELRQVRACLRGRSMRRRIYHPDRLKYPMKRVGKRGEGRFKRISWEEAFDTLACTLQRIIREYGNEAIYLNYGTGTLGGTLTRSWPPGSTLIARLMNCCGGYLNHYGDYSSAQIAAGLNYTYGGWADGNSPSDIENSKLVVLFGNNPAETRMSGGGVTYAMAQARQKSGARLIIIDPRYTDTGAGREDQWIPLRPGTDAALASALAYVMITEGWVDQPFLDTYCVGYDEKTLPPGVPANASYKAYILGQGRDGIAKTPAWAADITGVPEEVIIRLAREMGSTQPVFISQGWGPQRHANGELTTRAIAMLAIITGNVGIPGGNSGAREGSYALPFVRMPTLENPVKTSISMFLWTEAVARGPELTALKDGVRGKEKLDVPIKFIWNYAGNCLINQHADINRTHQILQDESRCEMIVVIDNHMTASAKYADILLPDCTTAEQMDFCLDASSGEMGYVIFADRVIAPRFECKTLYEMTSELAKRLGVEAQFTEGRSQEEWLRHLYQQSREAIPALPEFEQFRQQGIFKQRDPEGHHVAYRAFREDPISNPLATPSGKIELYSAQLATISSTWQLDARDVIDPLPIYAEGAESYNDPLNHRFPLQLTGFHYKARTHSTYGNVDVLSAACRQDLWINPIDAQARGIKNGDPIRVLNDRGEVRTTARVTPRIIPGVVALAEGAWYSPDTQRIDHGGSINVLTSQRPSPLAKGNPSHSNLVQVEKVHV